MSTPTFGIPAPGCIPKPRLAAYAVIWDEQERLLVVRGPRGCFLPGGAIEPSESAQEALHREAVEELGVDVHLVVPLGAAIQYFEAEDLYWKMEARFFRANLLGDPRAQNVEWLPSGHVDEAMFHACHVWAATHFRVENR